MRIHRSQAVVAFVQGVVAGAALDSAARRMRAVRIPNDTPRAIRMLLQLPNGD